MLAEKESISNIWNLPSYFRLAVKNSWELTVSHLLRKESQQEALVNKTEEMNMVSGRGWELSTRNCCWFLFFSYIEDAAFCSM